MSVKVFQKSQKKTIWRKYFGNEENGIDAFGREVNKSTFVCDHIFPKSLEGKTNNCNGMPLSSESNIEKSDKLSGTINGKEFEVKGSKHCGQLYVNGVLKSKKI